LSPHASRAQYEQDGFTILPPFLTHEQLDALRVHMHRVMDGIVDRPGHYQPAWKKGDNPTVIRKIDQSHVVDATIHDMISHPQLGRWAHELTGANFVQVWATQLLYKPPGGADKGNVGWHQDQDYWTSWWGKTSNIFTAWVAISDVRAESGPMRFVKKSHLWGHRNQGDFFGQELEKIKSGINIPEGEKWEEIPALMPAGACSFHHRWTIHGSGPNLSEHPRMSFAIHLRTEDSKPAEKHYYNEHLDDPIVCPVIWRGDAPK